MKGIGKPPLRHPDPFARWMSATALVGMIATLTLCIQHLG